MCRTCKRLEVAAEKAIRWMMIAEEQVFIARRAQNLSDPPLPKLVEAEKRLADCKQEVKLRDGAYEAHCKTHMPKAPSGG